MPRERSESAFRRIVNPRAETHGPSMFPDLTVEIRCLRTGSPSLCTCLASGETTSILPASALRSAARPCDLSATKTRDAFDRLLPPERNCVYPYLVRSW